MVSLSSGHEVGRESAPPGSVLLAQFQSSLVETGSVQIPPRIQLARLRGISMLRPDPAFKSRSDPGLRDSKRSVPQAVPDAYIYSQNMKAAGGGVGHKKALGKMPLSRFQYDFKAHCHPYISKTGGYVYPKS